MQRTPRINNHCRSPHSRPWLGQLLATSLLTVSLFIQIAPAAGQELAPELEPFAYRLGTWTAVVEFLNREGEVVRSVPSLREVTVAFGGKALRDEGRLFGQGIEILSMILTDEADQTREVAISSSGRVDYLYPSFEQGQVILSHDLSEGRGEVLFRAIDSNFEPDKYQTTGWISRDGGESWRQTFRQINYRTDL